MGILDDAIREHLDLKRRHGTAEDELQREEEEALGRGGPSPAAASEQEEAVREGPMEPTSIEAADDELEPFDAAEDSFGPEGPAPSEPEELAAEVRGAEPPPVVPEPEEIEPDEVLPEEALELEPSALPEPPSKDGNGARSDDWRAAEGSPEEADQGDDLLDDMPEYREDAPDQDRLWFEQKPPKDFDFDE
jgi:hypothetical protein